MKHLDLCNLCSCLRQNVSVLHCPGRPPACEHWREYSEMVLQRQKESSFPSQAHLSCMQAWMYISRLRRSRQSANAEEVSNLWHSSRWGGRGIMFKRCLQASELLKNSYPAKKTLLSFEQLGKSNHLSWKGHSSQLLLIKDVSMCPHEWSSPEEILTCSLQLGSALVSSGSSHLAVGLLIFCIFPNVIEL